MGDSRNYYVRGVMLVRAANKEDAALEASHKGMSEIESIFGGEDE